MAKDHRRLNAEIALRRSYRTIRLPTGIIERLVQEMLETRLIEHRGRHPRAQHCSQRPSQRSRV